MPIVGTPSSPAGGTAVPTDGTFVNANWAEVFFSDHDYSGRTIVTNGLLLLDLSIGLARLARVYLWSTGLSPAAWQQVGDLLYEDNSNNIATLRSISMIREGAEESSLALVGSTSGNQAALVKLRLQRGRYEVRTDLTPLTQATTGNLSLALTLPAVPKIIYNSGAIADVVLSEAAPAAQTDYGYGAAFIASSAQPYIVGTLYQNQSGSKQPYNAGNVATIGLGDTTSLAINAQRSYGFFAVPYGVSGTYSTANLQAEAESGALGTGWSSVVDAAASGGHAAKAASGTLTGNSDLFGTAFVPAPGTYDVWFRVKVTSAAGSSAEMNLGLWDSTSSAFVGFTAFKANQSGTSYGWLRAATAVTPTAGHNMQFAAGTAATLGTDWFIDEAVLVPHTLTAANTGPRDIWQQFAFDRSARLVRP